jgi:hypothetical protein
MSLLRRQCKGDHRRASGRRVALSSIGLVVVRHAGPLYDKSAYLANHDARAALTSFKCCACTDWTRYTEINCNSEIKSLGYYNML